MCPSSETSKNRHATRRGLPVNFRSRRFYLYSFGESQLRRGQLGAIPCQAENHFRSNGGPLMCLPLRWKSTSTWFAILMKGIPLFIP